MRYLKRFFFLAATVGTLTALFYAFENWRGTRDYQNTMKQLRSDGEELEFAKLTPTLVPATENFGSSPFLQSLQQTGAPGSPQSKIEAVLGAIRDVQDAENSAQFLAIAERLRDESGSQEAPMTYIEAQLEPWQSVRRELVARLTLPHAQWNRTFESGRQADAYSVFSIASMTVLKLTAIQAKVHLIVGDSAAALDDIRIGLRLGEMYRQEPGWIVHILFLANLALLGEPLSQGLQDATWNETQLGLLDNELSKIDFRQLFQTAMCGERAFALTFTRAATDGWRLHVFGQSLAAWKHLAPQGWALRGFAVLAEAYQESVDRVRKADRPLGAQLDAWETFWMDIAQAGPTAWTAAEGATKVTGIGNAFLDAARKLTLHRAAIQVSQFKHTHGRYPTGLDELVVVPRDPRDDGPLSYQPQATGFRIELPDEFGAFALEVGKR